jgi:ectoine hydroxylase-related dioxygenase (phytanoyl-CoA dioxygenase family)
MTLYPHSVRRSVKDPGRWFYSDLIGNHMECEMKVVVGGPGSIFAFHCMTLHGTGFNDSENPRISLRYLVRRTPGSAHGGLHDRANDKIVGPMKLLHSRLDVGVDNTFQRTGSSLNSYSRP